MSDRGFDQFWDIYPRRVAKLAAKRKYEAALRHASEEEILAGAIAYARATANTEMQFIKHPATWLHGGCWEDDMAAVAPRKRQMTRAEQMQEDLRRRIADEQNDTHRTADFDMAPDGRLPSIPGQRITWRH